MAGQYTLQQLQQLGLIGQDTLNEMFANSFGLSGIGGGYGAGNMRWQPNSVQEMGGEGGPYFTGLQAAPPSWMAGGESFNESGVANSYMPGLGDFSQDAYNKANGYTFDWQKTGPRGGGALTVFDPTGKQAGQYQQQSDQTFWQGVLEAGALAAAGFGGVGLMGLGPLGGLLGGAGAGAAGAAEGAALGGLDAAGLAGAEGAFSTGALADGLGGITASFGASPEFLALTSGELAGGAGGLAGLGASGGGSGGFATGMLGDGVGAISTGFGASPEFMAATGGAMEGAGGLMGAGLGGSIGAAAPVLPGTATALTAAGGGLFDTIGKALKDPKVIGGMIGSGAQLIGAGMANNAISNSTDKSNELLKYMYDTTRADNMPALNARNQSLTQATSLLANPSSITSDPGYQFGLSQGIKAYDNSGSAKGMRLSGQQAKALTQYGQDYGGTKLTESLNRLMAVASGGQAGAGTIANAGNSYANGAAANTQTAGNALSNLYMGTGTGVGNAINGLTAYGAKKNWWES